MNLTARELELLQEGLASIFAHYRPGTMSEAKFGEIEALEARVMQEIKAADYRANVPADDLSGM